MGDYSRRTFDPTRHYSGVLLQQGRVLLDADWNEAEEIRRHRSEVETTDVIGRCGVPRDSGAFSLRLTPDGRDLAILPGRIYVDGLLCELEASWQTITSAGAADRVAVTSLLADRRPLRVGQWVEISAESRSPGLVRILSVDEADRELVLGADVATYFEAGAGPARLRRITTYLTQPDLPRPDYAGVSPVGSPPESPASPPASPPGSPPESPVAGMPALELPDGPFLAYLDVWELEVTALDDPSLREVALGGPDTATRTRTVWQLRLLPVTVVDGDGAACDTGFPEWEDATASSTGMLQARVEPGGEGETLCELPPETGYQRLENQLYRVEVQQGGDVAAGDTVTFRWSRDNATVESTILEISGTRITVADLGRDEVLGFAAGQWVEVVDEVGTSEGTHNPLLRIASVDPELQEITVHPPAPGAEVAGRPGLKLRRWDQTGESATVDGLAVTGDWTELEANVQVRFREGRYRAGDFWIFPARTATGDIEWPRYEPETGDAQPVPLPPRGTLHHFCRLALLDVTGGAVADPPTDCRPTFPPLTDISAGDVGYDNEVCQLPGAETVQDALDVLCAARDLRTHNKYLHGSGVVCGLKVRCGADRLGVRVEEGYALDCEGYDVLVGPEGLTVDLIRDASARELLDENGDGEVCLGIRRGAGGEPVVTVEAHPEQELWKELLEGTLLMDFFQECIEDLFRFLEDQFLPIPATEVPVPVSQKRLISFLNLLWQLVNSTTGRYVFLSSTGADPATGDPEEFSEHEFLRRFYLDLQDRLSTGTFCGMFDDHPPYPEYPYQAPPGIATAFGLFGFHTRMRLNPARPVAYTCGTGRFIHVWDIEAAEMVERLEFPAGGDLRVVDVAVDPQGDRLYAVALLNDTDSVFATARPTADGTHEWGDTTVVCGTEFVRLATSASRPNNLYATGKASGLYVFTDPGDIPVEPAPTVAFNATGLLALSPDGNVAYAAENTEGEEGEPQDDFTRIRSIDLGDTDAGPVAFVAGGRDSENDLEVSDDRLYLTCESDETEDNVARVFERQDGTLTAEVDLGVDGVTRLALLPSRQALLVSLADSYEVARVDTETHELDTDFRIPVQIIPSDVRVPADESRVVVLNVVSHTLSVVSTAEVLDAESPPPFLVEPPLSLSNYRQDILDAYGALLGEFLQYLKDCFCDQFLVDCPTCGQDERVELGCVEVRGGRVYKICNLENRSYVKTPATWEYWLSAVPVLPLLKYGFTRFCCMVLDPVPSKRSQGASSNAVLVDQ